MKQEISNATSTEESQIKRHTSRFFRRVGLFLTAALLMIMASAFASTSAAHASGGGCWSYNTWSHSATSQDNGTPSMYGNNANSPALGLGLNTCQQYIMVKWQDRGYDYYKVDWTRPGENGWKEFRVSGQSYDGYMYKNFANAHFGTYYNFAVKGCISHWYGDSCDDWSPTVGIHT